jgi:hypothetical protein
MSMASLTANLDRGTHHEAQAAQKAAMAAFADHHVHPAVAGDKKSLHRAATIKRGPDDEPVTAGRYLSALAESEGVGPDDLQIKMYEDHWLKRLKVRPNEWVREEKVKQYARDRWTLDALFVEAGLGVRGPLSKGRVPSTVQKAFTTSTTQVIFPFYFSAALEAGILASAVLDRIIFDDIPVNSHTADHGAMTDIDGDGATTESGEGAIANEVSIVATNRVITLRKFMSKALQSYEAMRLARLPVFERTLMRVGQRFANLITDYGVEILIAGDGAGDGAAGTVAASASKNYDDILALEFAFSMGYEMEDGLLLCDKAIIKQILGMAEFKDAFAGGRYAFHGEMPTPINHPLVRWDYTGRATSYATTKLVHLKPDLAMLKYTEGGVLVETDRIIDGQWDRSVASTWTGFGIWDRGATKVSTGW